MSEGPPVAIEGPAPTHSYFPPPYAFFWSTTMEEGGNGEKCLCSTGGEKGGWTSPTLFICLFPFLCVPGRVSKVI